MTIKIPTDNTVIIQNLFPANCGRHKVSLCFQSSLIYVSSVNYNYYYSGPILESKGMHSVFQKKGKNRAKKC